MQHFHPVFSSSNILHKTLSRDEDTLTKNKKESGIKVGGLDLSRRDLDAKKVSVSTVEKISTVSKS